jgi:hypothetical protein
VTDTTKPAPDPIEGAVATVLLEGGEVHLETDRLSTPETQSELRVSYRGRGRAGITLAGSVTGWAEKHAVGLATLGWEPIDILSMGRLERTWIRQAEERRQELGIDYRLPFERSWALPPLTPDDVAANLRATLGVIDGRPTDQVRYVVHRDGPLERRVLRSSLAFGIISLLVGVFLAGYFVFRPNGADPGFILRAVLAGVLTAVVILFPVRRRIERLRGAGKWAWLPLWTGTLFLPAAAILAWAAWGF